jgi:ribonuclease P protein component
MMCGDARLSSRGHALEHTGKWSLQDFPPSAAPQRLKRRADFLRAAKGKRFHARGFTLQAATQFGLEQRGGDRIDSGSPAPPPRFGFTVTKKIGKAVLRNRIRRRLKEAVRTAEALPVRTGHDYVLIARIEALRLGFHAMQAELVRSLGGIEAGKSKAQTPRSQSASATAAPQSKPGRNGRPD